MTNHNRRFDADAFIQARRARGWSVPALATAAGISASYAFLVARGCIPGEPTRIKIAAALRVGEDDLWPTGELAAVIGPDSEHRHA